LERKIAEKKSEDSYDRIPRRRIVLTNIITVTDAIVVASTKHPTMRRKPLS